MLGLYLRWERGELVLMDPATGRRIATFEDERVRADWEREARTQEREAHAAAEAERNAERTGTDSAEARIRELEAENRRLRGG